MGAARDREGVITGYVFKVIRESLGATQEQAADALGVDVNTVQGWESGRRGLTATRVSTFMQLRRRLRDMGAADVLVGALEPAMEADYLLSYVVNTDPRTVPDLRAHPLASSVLQRNVVDMLAWPFTGTAPAALRRQPTRRSGPVPDAPMIDANQRGRFFTHLRTTVDQALRTPGVHETQPHRQIYYLMQWDHHADTRAWLEAVQRVEQRRWRIADGWTPQWVTARSMAVTYARHGDADPLRWFIETAMRDEEAQDADLNYWAYWVGEVPTVQRSDEFMAGGLGPWRGDLLLRRFYDGLVPDERSLDLYAHSARALIQRRPRLLTEGPDLAAALQLRLETLLDAGELNPSTKRALEDIRFGLRLVGIPKPPM